MVWGAWPNGVGAAPWGWPKAEEAALAPPKTEVGAEDEGPPPKRFVAPVWGCPKVEGAPPKGDGAVGCPKAGWPLGAPKAGRGAVPAPKGEEPGAPARETCGGAGAGGAGRERRRESEKRG